MLTLDSHYRYSRFFYSHKHVKVEKPKQTKPGYRQLLLYLAILRPSHLSEETITIRQALRREKLTVVSFVKKFTVFYRNRKSIYGAVKSPILSHFNPFSFAPISLFSYNLKQYKVICKIVFFLLCPWSIFEKEFYQNIDDGQCPKEHYYRL
jgi:hypothetical protein